MTDQLHSDHDAESETPAPTVRLVVINDYCTYAKGSDCQRCVHACPHGAITLPDQPGPPTVDHARCTGCGICFGICDAFASTRNTLPDLHARIRRIALAGDRCYLTCRENIFPDMTPASNVIVLPCLSMLSPEFWTLLMAEKIRLTVACDLKYCDDCSRAGTMGANLFPRAIEIAEERTDAKVLFNYRIPEKQTITEKLSDTDELNDRREVFTNFATDMSEIVSGKRRLKNSTVLQDFYERRERQRAASRLNFANSETFNSFVPHGHMRRVLFPKQRLIVESAQRDPEIAKRIPVAVSVTDLDLCTKSYACVSSCPTGARCPQEETGQIEVEPQLCIGCGICVETCAQGACSIEEATAEIYLDAEEPPEA